MRNEFTLDLDQLNPEWQQQSGRDLLDFWKIYTQNGGNLKGITVIGGVVIQNSNPDLTSPSL